MILTRDIPASVFGLQTNGARITFAELINEEGNKVQFYKVLGEIYPVDTTAPVINFQINLPLKWNGKLVHFGGGGFNGYLITGLGRVPCEGERKPTALERGYATCGSDSGHVNTAFWDISWALNDECLENFGYAHIKKVKDVASFIIHEHYGSGAEKVFFVGSSNGGREALMAVQRYPEDYDGVVVGYPVFNWTAKILTDYRNMKFMDEAGPKGFISAEQFIEAYAKVREFFEEQGCMKNGLVQDLEKCELLKEEAFLRMRKVLSQTQIDVLKNFYKPMEFEYELANGVKQMQGFSIVQQFCDHKLHPFGKIPGARDGLFAKTVDAIIRYQILRNENADIKSFNYREHKKVVQNLSNIMDATNPKLSAFQAKGGKVLMAHGTSDQLLSLHAIIDYYNQVVGYFGEDKAENFIKLFLMPGFGHDYGEVFNVHADMLQILDNWVENGVAPKEIIAEDQNEATYGRTQILKAFK